MIIFQAPSETRRQTLNSFHAKPSARSMNINFNKRKTKKNESSSLLDLLNRNNAPNQS